MKNVSFQVTKATELTTFYLENKSCINGLITCALSTLECDDNLESFLSINQSIGDY